MEIVQSNSNLIIQRNKNLKIEKTLMKQNLGRECAWPSNGNYFNILGIFLNGEFWVQNQKTNQQDNAKPRKRLMCL